MKLIGIKTATFGIALLGLFGVATIAGCGGQPDAPITDAAGTVYEVGVTQMT